MYTARASQAYRGCHCIRWHLNKHTNSYSTASTTVVRRPDGCVCYGNGDVIMANPVTAVNPVNAFALRLTPSLTAVHKSGDVSWPFRYWSCQTGRRLSPQTPLSTDATQFGSLSVVMTGVVTNINSTRLCNMRNIVTTPIVTNGKKQTWWFHDIETLFVSLTRYSGLEQVVKQTVELQVIWQPGQPGDVTVMFGEKSSYWDFIKSV